MGTGDGPPLNFEAELGAKGVQPAPEPWHEIAAPRELPRELWIIIAVLVLVPVSIVILYVLYLYWWLVVGVLGGVLIFYLLVNHSDAMINNGHVNCRSSCVCALSVPMRRRDFTRELYLSHIKGLVSAFVLGVGLLGSDNFRHTSHYCCPPVR